MHQRAGAESIGAVVGKVGFAEHEQPGQSAHQVVIHPGAAHGVMHGRINAHRDLVRILAGDLFVHIEEVAVALADDLFAQAPDGVRKIQVNPQAAWPDPAAFVTNFLGRSR